MKYVIYNMFIFIPFYIKFRSCETFTVTNSGAIILLIEMLSNFKAIDLL